MLLAVAAYPPDVTGLDIKAIEQVAAIAGLAPADVRMRLAGVLPRVLLNQGGAGAASASTSDDSGADPLHVVADALHQLRFETIVCDPATVPGDGDRILAQRLEFAGAVLRVWDPAGNQHDCPRDDIWLMQKGVRIATDERTVTSRERHLDLGRAVMSGGLLLTKSTTRTQTFTTENRDPFLLVHRRSGAGDVLFYERRIDYRFLGGQIQPASHGNFQALIARLQAFRKDVPPAAPLDDRVGRPGFVNGLPRTPADPVDLALHLVALSVLRLGTAAR